MNSSSILKELSKKDEELRELIKQQGLCCMIDAKSEVDRYTVYATNLEEIEKCKKIVNQLIK